ncbi:MAG: hypothetical protein ACK4VM_12765 [Bosea sp. (in: a-proteobacteria)]
MSDWLARLGDLYGYDRYDAALQQFAAQGIEPEAAKRGLTRTEALAIYFYTYQFGSPGLPGLFARVNANLRSPSQSHSPDFIRDFAGDLTAALQKAPPYRGGVYRRTDIPISVRGNLDRQIAFQDPGFLSASLRPDVFAGRDMLLLMSRSGRRIGRLSAWPSEDEVVFLPRTSFSIDEICQVGDTLLLQLTEQS